MTEEMIRLYSWSLRYKLEIRDYYMYATDKTPCCDIMEYLVRPWTKS